MFDETLLEEIEETRIQIKKILDWKYWIDYYNEVHYRPCDNSNREYFINHISPVITNVSVKQAKDIISKLVNYISLAPFTPKFTALDITPWTIDEYVTTW